MADPKGERPNRRNGRPAPNGGGMRFSRGLFGWFLFATLCIALFVLLNNKGGTFSNLSISQVMTQLQQDNIRIMTLEGDTVKGEFKNPTPFNGPPVTRFRAEVPAGALSGELGAQ